MKKVKSEGTSPDELSEEEYKRVLVKRAALRWRRKAGHEVELERQMREGSGELFPGWAQGISPRVEGRVRCVKSQQVDGQVAESEKINSGAESGSKSMLDKAKAVVVDGLAKVKS